MATKSTKPTSKVKKTAPKRSFFSLVELVEKSTINKDGYTLNDLLDYATTGQLILSFPVSNRYVVSGDYEGQEEVFEIPHAEDSFSGLLPLTADAVWRIISDGKATIEYLFRNEYEFKKFLADSEVQFPVVETKQLMVTAEDWDRFTGGLPPEPKYPEKSEDPKIIGALAYLYANAEAAPEFFKKNGELVIDQVVQRICELVSDEDGTPLQGMSPTTIQGKISEALSLMEPKINKVQGKSISK